MNYFSKSLIVLIFSYIITVISLVVVSGKNTKSDPNYLFIQILMGIILWSVPLLCAFVFIYTYCTKGVRYLNQYKFFKLLSIILEINFIGYCSIFVFSAFDRCDVALILNGWIFYFVAVYFVISNSAKGQIDEVLINDYKLNIIPEKWQFF